MYPFSSISPASVRAAPVPQPHNGRHRHRLLYFGNPLLNMVLDVNSSELSSKCGLWTDDQTETNQQQKPLSEVFGNGRVSFCPGGSAENTTRRYRRVLGELGSVAFIDAVGVDKLR